MDNLIAQYEQKQIEFTNNANALYNRLVKSGEQANAMVTALNNQKIRIFIAKIKLFIKKLTG